ncbi:MAG: N-acetyl-gamma-glutamyl-phosphate reductase [Steroidobacteraceae bacterium]
MSAAQIPTFVLGGTGYVAGELLRLIAGHPNFKLAGVLSDSRPGEPVAAAFPHLASAYADTEFISQTDLDTALAKAGSSALFGAAPHGVSAALIDSLLTRAEAAGAKPRVVDISADYRYTSNEAYTAVYKHPHGAPSRLAQFTCAVPEHLAKSPTPHIAHPGCFATAILLASVPLLKLDLVETQLFVSGVTGSTGSGRKPGEGTHHPTRHSDLYSYGALTHRHVAEVTACAQAASGRTARFAFVPHSGPFSRGIHVTVQAMLRSPNSSADVVQALKEFYAHSAFIRVSDKPPRVKDVVTSNYAHLSAASDGNSVAVMSVVDNLAKGAAGGAVQWMNRLFDLPETAGLTAPAPGWT